GFEWINFRQIWTNVRCWRYAYYNWEGDRAMVPEHEEFEVAFNAFRQPGELSVVFSGKGKPVGGHRQGPAVHDYYLIHTVRSGRGEFLFRGTRYECKAGDSFVIFPGELFR